MNAFDKRQLFRFQKGVKFNSFAWLLTDQPQSKLIKAMPSLHIDISHRSVPKYKEMKILTKAA